MESPLAIAPLSMPTIWKTAFQLAKASLKKIWFWLLLYIILGVLYSTAADRFAQVNEKSAIVVIAIIAAALIIYILRAYLFGVIFLQVADTHEHKNTPVGQISQLSLAKLPKMIGVSILALIITALGIVALVLPGIFVAFCFMILPAIVYLEDKKISEIFKYDFSLVWGNWWRNLGVFILPSVIYVVITILMVQFLAGGNMTASGDMDTHSLRFLIVTSVVNYFFLAYFYALMLIQFKDLKARYFAKQVTPTPSA